jgi:dihydrofolate reductase
MPERRPEIVIVAAVAANRALGKDNALLWHIPEDMAHFKALTAGQTVLMGRKTWESLPPRFRPLPGRRNIVITRQTDYAAPGAEVAGSLENGLKLASTAEAVFVIGGAEIYAQALALADRLELTEVALSPEADAWFPAIDPADWQVDTRREIVSSNGPGVAFVRYRRPAG